jgi:undecaprenyl-diphosphatase
MIILETIKSIDHFLFQTINQYAFKWLWLDILGVFLANYLVYLIVIFLLLFLLRFKKYWEMVLKALISAVFARFIIVEIIRLIYPRQRPFIAKSINLLVDKLNQLAFPSGHAAFCFGLATIVYFYNKKIGILLFFASGLISISRVFVGIHWPTDILAGALVGIFSGWFIQKITEKYFKKIG